MITLSLVGRVIVCFTDRRREPFDTRRKILSVKPSVNRPRLRLRQKARSMVRYQEQRIWPRARVDQGSGLQIRWACPIVGSNPTAAFLLPDIATRWRAFPNSFCLPELCASGTPLSFPEMIRPIMSSADAFWRVLVSARSHMRVPFRGPFGVWGGSSPGDCSITSKSDGGLP